MRGKYLLLATLMATTAATAEQDLGSITVESSTIVDLDVDKRTEASTVNIIDEQLITEIDPKNINDILQTIPGITADVRTGDTVEIHVRGIGQQEFMWEDTGVAVVIDGVPVLQNGGKVKFNMDEIESIKVIKGGASYLYGNTALAGAVIITTKKNKTRSGGEVSAEYGSENYQNYKAKYYTSTEKYAVDLLTSYRYTDGYWDMSENDSKTASGKFTYFIDDSSDIAFNVDITRKYEESTRGGVTGVTEAENNPTGADDGDWPWSHDYDSDIDKYYMTYNKDFANGNNLMVNAYYYEDLYDYQSHPVDLSGDGEDDTYISDNNEDIKEYGIKAEYKGTTGGLAYMLGTDIGKRELDDYNLYTADYSYYSASRHKWYYYYTGETSEDKDTENKFALYGELKGQFGPRMTITMNARYDYDNYETETYEHSYDGTTWEDTVETNEETFRNMSYRFGTAYELDSGSTLYANFSTGFRNPRVSQMDTNPDLKTETSANYEVGIRGKLFNTLSYEASLYITDTKDIIGKRDGTYFWDRDNYVYDNVGDARSKGLELSLSSDQSKALSFSLAYTYLDAYYTKHNPFSVSTEDGTKVYDIVNNQLPRTPHHKLDLILNYRPNDKWNFMAEFYAQSSYYGDETNLVKFDGYGKLNLKATYHSSDNLEFFAKVDNVLDNQYYRSVYLYSDRNENGVLDAEDATITVDPGRQVYVGMKYKF